MKKALIVFLLLISLCSFSQSVTEVLYPKYVQGVGSGVPSGDRKVPYACRMTITGLTPDATYRYYSRFVFDPNDATNGTGAYILVNQTGNFVRVTVASLGTAGLYGEFTTNSAGQYTGWFIAEPTSDPLFQPGTQLYWRIMLNDGNGGGTVVSRVTVTNPVTVLNWSTAQTTGGFVNGSALWGATNSSFAAKNFVMLYDNISGTGRPVTGTFIEADGTANTIANGYVPFYQLLVNEVNTRWGTIIPNNLATGINNISQYALLNGAFINSCTAADGVYSSINQSGVAGTTDTKNANWGLTVSFTSTTPRNVNCTPGGGCNISLSASVTNVSCNGGNNGAINLTVTGATGAVTYGWSNGAATEDLSGLAAGTYTVTVTDASNCTATATAIVTQPTQLTASSSATPITIVGGTTTVTVTAAGGTPPYTGTGTFVRGAGTYTFTITDANSCTTTTTITLTDPGCSISLSASVANVSCNGGNDGAINLTVTGATGAVTYSWSNGAATEDLGGLTTGTYTVTVTDASNCAATATAIVTQPIQLTASSSAPPITVVGGTTTVTVTATGGTPPYTGTGTFVRGAGTYTFTVTDANGCTATTTITLTEPGCSISLSASVTDVSCNGGNNGAINLTVTGTTGAVTYSWNNGATTEDMTGLAAGVYTGTVTDASNCTASVTVVVAQPTQLLISETHTAISCFGETSTVTVSATGGTSPYAGTGVFNQSAGIQSYTITDANGCVSSVNVTVNQPAQLIVSETHTVITCAGNNSTVTISAAGGTSPYTGTGVFIQSAGTQSYTVTDANGCTSLLSVTISAPSVLAISENHTAIACSGGNSAVTISATGGTAPYTGTGTFTQAAGTQLYSVQDVNGCTGSLNVTITQPSPLAVNETHTTIPCFGGASSVTITATGGTAPYTGTGTFAQAASSQSYTVTDANGCSASLTVILPQPAASLVASSVAGTIPFHGGTTRVTVTATGGTPPYFGTGVFIVYAGAYSYTVKDVNGCTAVTTGIITEPAAPTELTLTINPNPGNGYLNITVSSNDNNRPVIVRIMNAEGKVMMINHNVGLNSPIQIGQSWSAGVYFAEAIQGEQKKTMKVVKMN